MTAPNPGSDEAYALGCKCARMDNAYGKGYMGMPNVFCVSGNCLLHASGDLWPPVEIPLDEIAQPPTPTWRKAQRQAAMQEYLVSAYSEEES